MDLVEVDGLHTQAAETGLHLPADGIGPEGVIDRSLVIPEHAALGEDKGARPLPVGEGLSHDLLGVTETVDGCRVDPVHAEFERAVDCGD